MNELPRPITITRRRALTICAALAGLVFPVLRRPATRDGDGDFVIVNGWVLRRDDLLPR